MGVRYLGCFVSEGILESRLLLTDRIDTKAGGYASVLFIDKVNEAPPSVYNGRDFVQVEKGYIWTCFIPEDKGYVLTTIFNSQGGIVLWRFDMCGKTGIDKKRGPFYEEMFLSVVVPLSCPPFFAGEEELAAALDSADVNIEDAKAARERAAAILSQADKKALMKQSLELFEHMIKNYAVKPQKKKLGFLPFQIFRGKK